MPVQHSSVARFICTVIFSPMRPTGSTSAAYNAMINADSKPEIGAKRKAFIRKWRLKCRAVAVSLEEAGDKLFTFSRFGLRDFCTIGRSAPEF